MKEEKFFNERNVNSYRHKQTYTYTNTHTHIYIIF